MTDLMKTRRLRPVAVAGPILASTGFVIELTTVPLLLTFIQADFGLSLAQLTWVFNIYAAAVAAAVLAGGWLGDLLGNRRIFVIGALLFALGSCGVALAETYAGLLAARLAQGAGGGLFSPLVPVLLTGATPNRPGRILILWGSLAGFVAAFAPLAGSAVIALAGWQTLFWAIALFGLLALGFAPALPRAVRDEDHAPRLPDLRRLIGAGRLWCVFVYVFCTYGAISFFFFDLPLEIDAAGLPPRFTGLVLAALWLSFAIAGAMMRNAVDGRLLLPITLSGPVLILGGVVLALWPFGPAAYLLGAMALGVGFACTNAPSTQLVLRFAPEGLRAISTSLDITFARLGGVLSVALLAKHGPGFVAQGIAVLTVLALIAAILCVHLSVRRKRP